MKQSLIDTLITSLTSCKRDVKLTRIHQKLQHDAEQKIHVLLEKKRQINTGTIPL